MSIPGQALLWGMFGGSALVLGSALGWFTRLPAAAVAAIMAFGSGVLISALSLELMLDAWARGGFWPTVAGFLGGATVYTVANLVIAKNGGKHRKRSGGKQPSEGEHPGSGLAIAVGSLIDGIPESLAIGLSLLAGPVSAVTVAAVFLSNVPEGLASAVGMKRAHRSVAYVFGVWTVIAVICGFASLAGEVLLAHAAPETIGVALATAAGAILAMLADTMIPEAVEETRQFTGLLTVLGFLVAFVLSRLEAG